MTALLESVQKEETLVQQSLKFHRSAGEALLQERETLIEKKDIRGHYRKHHCNHPPVALVPKVARLSL